MKKLMIVLSVALLAAGVFAESYDEAMQDPTPIAINLASPLKLPPFDRDVYGLRANIFYGHARDVYGLDVGLVGLNEGTHAGLQVGLFDGTDGAAYGAFLNGFCSYVTGDVRGLQLAGFLTWGLADTYGVQIAPLNFSTSFTGVQCGLLNWNSNSASGLQLGLVGVTRHDFSGAAFGILNFAHGDLLGLQVGLFNYVANSGRGCQIGLFNVADRFDGVQIGLANINVAGVLPIMVIVNANF